MERLSEIMMNLIANEVCGKAIDSENMRLTDDDLKQLYILSKKHDLAHLVGDALIRHKLLSDGEIKAKFEKQMMMAVYRYEKINYELKCLREVMNEAEIPFIPLKGSVIRQYYPEPWMRTSCDIDILVQEKYIDAAAQTIEKKLGYRYESRNYHDISLKSESGVHLELHFSLKENEENIDGLLSDCWQYAFVHKEYEYSFTPEFFLFHQYAHASYHFLHGGCGVRIFLDIRILDRFLSCDRAKLDALLQKCGILKFANEAQHLANIWFGTAEYTELSRQMERYILSGGVYGTTENRVALQQAKKGGKLKYIISRVWLPYNTIKLRYPILHKRKWLLPFYQVKRWSNMLFEDGAKRSVNELSVSISVTKEQHNEINSLLSNLELQ